MVVHLKACPGRVAAISQHDECDVEMIAQIAMQRKLPEGSEHQGLVLYLAHSALQA